MDIQLRGIRKTYTLNGGAQIPALRHVDLDLGAGEFIALMGPSGCGKTTLLSIIGLLSSATDGSFQLDGTDVHALSRTEVAGLRARSLGFIFQAYNLLPRENAWRNVMLPLTFDASHRASRRQAAMDALATVGLADRAGHFPSQMSGGEQQRVAIARALVNHPRLLIADEPTGNLDSENSREILELIIRLAKEYESSVIMATHDATVASYARRIIRMKDGRIVADEPGA